MPQTRRSLLQAGLGLAGATAAGSPSGWGAEPKHGGVLRISTNLRINTLNPMRHLQTPEYVGGEAMYGSLTTLSPKMEPEPALALGWDSNGDATEYVFHLRPGVKFHHGPMMTAEDAAATILAVLDPKMASPAQKSIGPITGASAIDAQTLKVTLAGPFADLPVSLAHTNAKIVPAAILQQDPRLLDSGDYGSGPYKLKSFDTQRGLRVERFDGYWIPGRPYLDAIETVLYPDVNTEAAALVNGETDLLLVAQPDTWDQLGSAAGVVPVQTQVGAFLNVILRMDTPPFDDVRVRRALALTIDRDNLVQLVLEGTGRAAYDDPISPEYRYYAAPAPFKPDIAEARRLLAEAGHPNGLKITLNCPNRPTARTALGVALREMARPAGFDIDVQTIPYDTYLASYWRKNNFYVSMLNMQATEDAMFALGLTTDAPWNETKWNNAEFDAVVAKARGTIDPAQRKLLYAQAQQMITRDLPWLIGFYQNMLAARRSYVQDIGFHPRGNRWYLERVWLGDDAPKRT